MEDIQRKLAKDVASQSLTKAAKKNRRWTLIFVGSDGRIFDIRMFRGWITISAVAVFLGAVAAFGFYFLYQRAMDDNKRLQSSLDVTRQELKSLRHEKDILMAQLVVAESIVESNIKTKGSKVQIKDKVQIKEKIIGQQAHPVQIVQIETKHDPDNSDKNDTTEAGGEHDQSTAPVPSQKPPVVGVEDLIVSFDSYNNSLKVEFIVRKMDPDLNSVSGRTFTILKPDETDDRKWLALPAVDLAAGKPIQPQQGQFFGIAHFKPIKLEAKHLSLLNPYKYATVFIFSTSGDLLFEKTFNIEIKQMAQ